MKRTFLLAFLAMGVILLLSVVIVYAQDPKPSSRAPNLAMSAVFTYQGQIRNASGPINGTCDMQFGLFADPTSITAQVGITQTLTAVSVSNGLFTARLNSGNEFTYFPFDGSARWLAIAVRCPKATGSYIPLSSRQEITPAPYALNLVPGAVISGTAATSLTAISTAIQGTGIMGMADNGVNAWGVYGGSASGIGVFAQGNDSTVSPNTALKVVGGAIRVGGTVSPAFIYTAIVVSSNCSSILHPLINGDPNAMIIVTPRQDTVTVPATDVRVIYNTGSWSLCSPSLAPGMKYNMLIINQ